MPEPVTITLLAVNGLGWLAGTMAGALTGGTTDRAFKSAVKGVRDRLAGIRGVPENHDIAHAVRLAMTEPRGPVHLAISPGVASAAAVPLATSCRPDPSIGWHLCSLSHFSRS